MRLSNILLTMLISSTAQAQMYQCLVDGETIFQDQPCSSDSETSKTITVRGTTKSSMFWNDLKYGMSVKQVQSMVTAAKPKRGDKLANGAEQQLGINNIDFAGTALSASFFFKEDHFIQVNMSGPLMVRNKDNLHNFENISTEFRNKYGQENKRSVKDTSSGLSADAEWSYKNGRIWIAIVPVTQDTSMLSLGYRPQNDQ